jgi:hypothetical protein
MVFLSAVATGGDIVEKARGRRTSPRKGEIGPKVRVGVDEKR